MMENALASTRMMRPAPHDRTRLVMTCHLQLRPLAGRKQAYHGAQRPSSPHLRELESAFFTSRQGVADPTFDAAALVLGRHTQMLMATSMIDVAVRHAAPKGAAG